MILPHIIHPANIYLTHFIVAIIYRNLLTISLYYSTCVHPYYVLIMLKSSLFIPSSIVASYIILNVAKRHVAPLMLKLVKTKIFSRGGNVVPCGIHPPLVTPLAQ